MLWELNKCETTAMAKLILDNFAKSNGLDPSIHSKNITGMQIWINILAGVSGQFLVCENCIFLDLRPKDS